MKTLDVVADQTHLCLIDLKGCGSPVVFKIW